MKVVSAHNNITVELGKYNICTEAIRESTKVLKNRKHWASLVVQWLRICLPRQGTRVRALVWEDPTCRGATRPVSHSC